MTPFINPTYTLMPSSGGNRTVNTVGSRRVAASLAIAVAIASPSNVAANDSVEPIRPARNLISQVSLRAVEQRFAQLCDIAEEEGIEINRSSYRSLKDFVRNFAGIRPPAIMLMEDGTFRGIWRRENEQQVALHFRESGKVQYVVFVTGNDGKMERATGLTSTSAVARALLAFNAKDILTDAVSA